MNNSSDKAKRYTEINELTGELLNLFIERIEVGEREERYSRTAEQTIIRQSSAVCLTQLPTVQIMALWTRA